MEEMITPIIEYKDSDTDPLNYIIVKVDIEGLKKKRFSNAPANGTLSLEVKDRSFILTVEVLDTKQESLSKCYKYQVKQLPAEVVTTEPKSFYKVKNGEVEIHLHKCQPKLWNSWLSSQGLEHYQEPNDL